MPGTSVGSIAVPRSGTVSGERTPPVEGTVSVAVRVPVAPVGANDSCTVQETSRPKAVPCWHVPPETENSALPDVVGTSSVTVVAAMFVTVTVALPALSSAWPPKSTTDGSATRSPATLPETVKRFVANPLPTGPPAAVRIRNSLPFVPPTIRCGVTASPRYPAGAVGGDAGIPAQEARAGRAR